MSQSYLCRKYNQDIQCHSLTNVENTIKIYNVTVLLMSKMQSRYTMSQPYLCRKYNQDKQCHSLTNVENTIKICNVTALLMLKIQSRYTIFIS